MRPRKSKHIKTVIWILGLSLIAMFMLVLYLSGKANALPCSNEQPFPDTGWSVCTGYGQTCPRVVCAYPPGTPGHWGVNGRYEPKVG